MSYRHPEIFRVNDGVIDERDCWFTPREIVEDLGPFDLDPCTSSDRPWDTAERHFTPGDDGLMKPWEGRVFLNPPYGTAMFDWLRRMSEHDGGGIALIPARTETEAFERFVWRKASGVLFIRKRIQFYKSDGFPLKSNPHASVLVAYSDYDAERLRTSRIGGAFVRTIERKTA